MGEKHTATGTFGIAAVVILNSQVVPLPEECKATLVGKLIHGLLERFSCVNPRISTKILVKNHFASGQLYIP